MDPIGPLAQKIVNDCQDRKVIPFPTMATREARIAFATRLIEDGIARIDRESGPLGGARIAILLLLEAAMDRGPTPNAVIRRGLKRLAEFFEPDRAA